MPEKTKRVTLSKSKADLPKISLNPTPSTPSPDVDGRKEGNTDSLRVRSRSWSLTLNNYTSDDLTQLTQNKLGFSACKWQPEKGLEKGTPHIQGYIEFPNPRYRSSLVKFFSGRANWLPCKDKIALIAYCSKEETRDTEVFEKLKKQGIKFEFGLTAEEKELVKKKQEKKPTKKPIVDKLATIELYAWQKRIIEETKIWPADDRKITWVVDTVGNSGKTSLARHLVLTRPLNVYYVSMGKNTDILYGVTEFVKSKHTDLELVIFDVPRCVEGHISYNAIEQIKNGIWFSSKYEGGTQVINPPHIVIFANFFPDTDKLSEDRWDIRGLTTKDFEILKTGSADKPKTEKKPEINIPKFKEEPEDNIPDCPIDLEHILRKEGAARDYEGLDECLEE